jgi:ABC-2 type transport system ATP-binding protein
VTDLGVELASVVKRFGRTRALDGVSLSARPGITGLLGPNGAGKTTLMRVVATVLSPEVGSVSVLGRDPAQSSARVAIRRRLGYMPQEPGFHPSFTAFEFVDYVAILKELLERRSRHQEVRRVLAAVGLIDVMHEKIKRLSGGTRRRVALAQALLGDPDLLVLDEPTAGLDPEHRLHFRELVSDRAEGRTVLLSTHQTEDVAALCERLVVLSSGRVAFESTPAELVELARGKVWLAEDRLASARLCWRTGEGRYRHVGEPPPGAELVEPTLEDGYLLLLGAPAVDGLAA